MARIAETLLRISPYHLEAWANELKLKLVSGTYYHANRGEPCACPLTVAASHYKPEVRAYFAGGAAAFHYDQVRQALLPQGYDDNYLMGFMSGVDRHSTLQPKQIPEGSDDAIAYLIGVTDGLIIRERLDIRGIHEVYPRSQEAIDVSSDAS